MIDFVLPPLYHSGNLEGIQIELKVINELMKKHNKSTYEKVEQFNIEKKPYVSKWHTEEFWEEFKTLCPYFREIYFAGGEPLDIQHCRKGTLAEGS